MLHFENGRRTVKEEEQGEPGPVDSPSDYRVAVSVQHNQLLQCFCARNLYKKLINCCEGQISFTKFGSNNQALIILY